MSNDIKPIYQDKSGNTHDTRAAAKKANRLIDAAATMSPLIDDGGSTLNAWTEAMLASQADEESRSLIEYARSVVAIYGMKDKAPKTEEAK